MTPIKTINLKGGYRVEIHIDESPESPRDWDNLGIIYSNSRTYDFDGHGIKELIEDVGGNRYDNVIPWEKIAKKYYYLKVWAYDHSGITVRTGESNPWGNGYTSWDSYLFGVIVCDKKKAMKEYGYKRPCKPLQKRVEQVLDGEIKNLDTFCRGEIYGYRTYNKDNEEIDSCWGFYDEEDAISEAKSTAEWDYKQNYGEELFKDTQPIECK